MAEITIEQMKAELEAVGYRFNFKPFDEGIVNGSGFWTPPPIIAHFEPPPLAVSRDEMEAYIIKTAYRHLEREKQFEAMAALLEEMVEGASFEYVLNWKEEIKAILGK